MNTTLSGNRAVGGTGGSAPGGTAGNDGGGHGGAIFAHNGTTIILASTIASNTALQGGAYEYGSNNGIVVTNVQRSIIADSTGPWDCLGDPSIGSGPGSGGRSPGRALKRSTVTCGSHARRSRR